MRVIYIFLLFQYSVLEPSQFVPIYQELFTVSGGLRPVLFKKESFFSFFVVALGTPAASEEYHIIIFKDYTKSHNSFLPADHTYI